MAAEVTPGRAETRSRILALEQDLLRIAGVLLARGGEAEEREVVRLQSGIDLQQAVKTFAEQAGGHQEDDSGGKFDDDEIRSDAAPVQAGGTASALAESVAHGFGGQADGGREGKQRGAAQRDGECEEQDVRSEADTLQVRHAGEDVFGNQASEQIHSAVSDQDADGAGAERQNESLGNELAQEPASRGAKSSADRDFTLAARVITKCC